METITLETRNTTYQIGIHSHGFLFHLYYGPKTKGDMSNLLTTYFRGGHGVPYDMKEDRTFSPDSLPMEYSCSGSGDYRNHAFRVHTEDGTSGCDLRYVSHRFLENKYSIPGLPASFGKARTCEIVTRDSRLDLVVILRYGIFYDEDVITRAVEVVNESDSPIYLNKVMSMSFDTVTGDYDLVHFWGRHFSEMHMEKTPVGHQSLRIGSRRGVTGHQHNNFAMLCEKETNEDFGPCYGFSFMYSGNFAIEAEKDQYLQTRISVGLSDELFDYPLLKGESFHTPEVLMTFSSTGYSGISDHFNPFIRNNVCRGRFSHDMRPIMVNNWEATYFDFTGDKLVQIAQEAAKLGIDMFVLDDGWFGERGPDTKGLGDWVVNEKKMGGPLKSVVDRINALGVKFGIWFEPEMVNEDSDLYRKHPDWALTIPGKPPVEGRCQQVLDFTREDVRSYILDKVCSVIDSANVEYVKLDMNRSLCDVFSRSTNWQNFGTLCHKYMLGVYDFLDKITSRYPNILFEGCSSGGARFDTGLMYYTPQIWTSDNTDSVERSLIQYCASIAYPVSTFGSHISAVPNHQNGRITDINARSMVAMSGNFGFELDLTTMTDSDKEAVKESILLFKQYWGLIHNGRICRISSYEDRSEYIAWSFVSKDRSETLLNILTTNTHGNSHILYVKCKGLDPDALYVCEQTKETYAGATLMYTGIPLPMKSGEYNSFQYYFTRI